MADENSSAQSCANVPDPKGRIPGSGDGCILIGHLETSHGRGVATQCVQTCSEDLVISVTSQEKDGDR